MFDWHRFLDLARQLESNSLDEAVLRTAINRAYYAAYHRASRYVRDALLVEPTTGLTHDLVWRVLARSSDDRHRSIAERGFAMKAERTRSDYQAWYRADLADAARKAIDVSEAIIRSIDAL